MDRPAPCDVVLSLSGHDRGQFYQVTGAEGERLLLCNGRNRGLENPKCKSPRHVRVVMTGAPAPASDREIRKTIALAAKQAAAKEEKLLGER